MGKFVLASACRYPVDGLTWDKGLCISCSYGIFLCAVLTLCQTLCVLCYTYADTLFLWEVHLSTTIIYSCQALTLCVSLPSLGAFLPTSAPSTPQPFHKAPAESQSWGDLSSWWCYQRDGPPHSWAQPWKSFSQRQTIIWDADASYDLAAPYPKKYKARMLTRMKKNIRDYASN